MAAPKTGFYSFLGISFAFTGPGGSFTVSNAGIGDGGIRISMAGDKNRMSIGAAGDGMHSLIASKAGRLTVSLLKTANGNAILNQIYRFQSASASRWGQNLMTLTDVVRGDLIIASSCAFVRQTDLVYAPEGNMNEWAFDSTDIDETLGNSYQDTGI